MPLPPPARPTFWRSPLRGPWLTAVLGSVLLVGLTIVALTGLVSYAAYDPRLAGNDLTPGHGLLGFYLFNWPTHPSWLYAATQGTHVTLGIVLVPVVLAKLWSVIPRLFEFPPLRSPAHALERLSTAFLVGGVLFEFATGIVNVQVYYPFHFSFYTAHFYGAWVFISAFVVHAAIKLPAVRRAYRVRGVLSPLLDDLASTKPEPRTEGSLVAVAPSEPTLSRRGLLALVGSGSLALLVVTVGQSAGGPLRRIALLAPHGRGEGDGPNGFQVNKTAAAVGITGAHTGPAWRLRIAGTRTRTLSRTELLALPQHHASLPIACVEGWSTTQHWSGVRLRDLAALAGVSEPSSAMVKSIQKRGVFSHATLSGEQVLDERSLLALHVNGVELSLDHGFPARIIIPGAPGVHQTKWVGEIQFQA
ncbi:MAG TPA: molybdopterin-dependent oxidoreductase [Solirubrobacteraceae bacterium]|nr:molybdopterin-dependent oxidoreductase [Solirubrobacteraceae bacterium]